MSTYPEDCRYAKSHEWVRLDGEIGYIGISDYAQKELGEIVFVGLPEAGQIFNVGDEFGQVESVKAVSELYMPVACEILEANPALVAEPGAVNEDPHGDAWLVKVRVSSNADYDELMSAEDYERYLAEEAKH
jgi:glycine cleavage system H protein